MPCAANSPPQRRLCSGRRALFQPTQLVAQVPDDDLAHRPRSFVSRHPREDHAANRRPTRTKKRLKVRKRRPHLTPQQTRQPLASPPEGQRQLTLRDIDRSEIQPDIHGRVMLDPSRTENPCLPADTLSHPHSPHPPKRRRVHHSLFRNHATRVRPMCVPDAQSCGFVQNNRTFHQLSSGDPHSRPMTAHSALLHSYVPFLPEATWERMRDAVLLRVAPYAHGRSEASTRQALAVVVGYVHWAMDHGLAADADTALKTAALIDTYVAHRAKHIRPHRAQREGTILHALCDAPPRPHRQTHGAYSPPDVPYTSAEVEQARVWAAYQPTSRTARDALALISLGFGCGLTSREMLTVRGRDLAVLTDGLYGVHVGARTVPALQEWSADLEDLHDRCPRDEWLLAPGWAGRTVDTLNRVRRDLPGDHVPSPRRMRNTWLVTQINSGTPATVVMRAAGLAEAAFLRRLAPYLPMPAPDTELAMLRGGHDHA